MRNKRFRPDGLDLAFDRSSQGHQGIRLLLLGTAILLVGLVLAAFNFHKLSAAQTQEANRQSRIKADQTTERASALLMNSRIEAAQAEARDIDALLSTDWLDLLTWLETAGKASEGRVVLLSLVPAGTDAQAWAVQITAIADTEADMLSYMEGFRRAAPRASAELISHQPEDNRNSDARRLVFLLWWTSPKEKTP